MGQFTAKSINLFAKDIRKIKKNSNSDKYNGLKEFDELSAKYNQIENALAEYPNDEDLQREERRLSEKIMQFVSKEQGVDIRTPEVLTANPERQINNLIPMAHGVAMSYANRSGDKVCAEELIGCACEGLVIAGSKYFAKNPSQKVKDAIEKGVPFSTFAWNWIRKYAYDSINAQGSIFGGSVASMEESNRNQIVYRDSTPEESDSTIVPNIFKTEMAKVSFSNTDYENQSMSDDLTDISRYLKNIFRGLSKYEKRIMFLYFGIDTPKNRTMTMEEIGASLGTTKKTICIDLKRAYEKMQRKAKNRDGGIDQLHMSQILLGSADVISKVEELTMASTYGFELEPKRLKVAV